MRRTVAVPPAPISPSSTSDTGPPYGVCVDAAGGGCVGAGGPFGAFFLASADDRAQQDDADRGADQEVAALLRAVGADGDGPGGRRLQRRRQRFGRQRLRTGRRLQHRRQRLGAGRLVHRIGRRPDGRRRRHAHRRRPPLGVGGAAAGSMSRLVLRASSASTSAMPSTGVSRSSAQARGSTKSPPMGAAETFRDRIAAPARRRTAVARPRPAPRHPPR